MTRIALTGTAKLRLAAAALACATALGPSVASADVEIEYWQYVFDARVKAMGTLIDMFEAENPGITVKQVTFPYADYQTRVVAAHVVGKGPDVVQLSTAGSTISWMAASCNRCPRMPFPQARSRRSSFRSWRR
ncbi:extracellular solute-binding protein [Paracoccus sp. SSJ]|nr:extracellular solute-binding protein [Paracoccus sp. SSJ]MDK8874255.1 extracellular solute-binding protein [Paracoccus sp. SSJ]